MGCNHLEGVPFLRYVDPPEHHRLKTFIEESAKAETPPRHESYWSIHLQMKDSSGISFNAELFHVSVPSLTSEKENSERALTSEEQSATSVLSADIPHTDMRHILGYGLPQAVKAERSVPSARSRSKKSSSESASSSDARTGQNLIRLRMLQKVNFTIDINSDDFQIESLTLTFGQTDNCPKDALPKLLEWIKPNYRSLLFNWAQSHANAFASGNPCKDRSWFIFGMILANFEEQLTRSGERFFRKRNWPKLHKWQHSWSAYEHRDAEAFCPLAAASHRQGQGQACGSAWRNGFREGPKQLHVAGRLQSRFETCACLASECELQDGTCSAPYFYRGTCPFSVNLLNYTKGMKATFAANCGVGWPLDSRYGPAKPKPLPARYPSHAPGQKPDWECKRNFNSTCPDGFNFDGVMCHEDGTYLGANMKNCAHFDARRWTDDMKEAFAAHCHVFWPCVQAPGASGSTNLRNGPVVQAVAAVACPSTPLKPRRQRHQVKCFL
eukprot:s359_g13.t1